MNAAESREVFIRQALVGGEFETRAPFFAHNQKLIADIEALEHKARRPDVLVDDELIFAFYDSRIPVNSPGMTSTTVRLSKRGARKRSATMRNCCT